MLKKAQRNKALAEAPMIVELYQNKNFVSESLSSVRHSSIAISADGQAIKRNVDNGRDCHIQAELPLPTLKERCAVSKRKDLYSLSKQLAENNEEENNMEKVREPTKEGVKKTENIKNVPRVNQANCSVKESTLVNKIVYKPFREIVKKNEQIENLPRQMRKKLTKTRNTKPSFKHVPSDSSDGCRYETADSVSEMQRKMNRKRPTKKLNCAEDSHVKPKNSKFAAELSIKQKLLELAAKSHVKQQISRKTTKSLTKSLKMFSNAFKTTMQTFDDWHIFTVLLFLGTFAYLIYILCYDINEYVNEELRYLAMMKKSGLLLKCFYYVMRLLKVQMF